MSTKVDLSQVRDLVEEVEMIIACIDRLPVDDDASASERAFLNRELLRLADTLTHAASTVRAEYWRLREQ